MKETQKQARGPDQDSFRESCAETHSKKIWIAGCAVIVLVAIFTAAVMSNKNDSPAQFSGSPLPGSMMPQIYGGQAAPTQQRYGGQVAPMQQRYGGLGFGSPYLSQSPMVQRGIGLRPRAVYGPNCPVYPNYLQPMPQYGPMQSSVPVQPSGPAYPNYVQPLAQDPGMQQVAVVNPHAGCPSFTQCFPPAAGGATPVAFTNPHAGCPSFTQCFPQGSATAVALTNPVMGAASAVMGNAPPIFRDAVMLHAFRGICENCHVVSPDVPISSKAQLPHQFRGVCSNCHVITDLPPAV